MSIAHLSTTDANAQEFTVMIGFFVGRENKAACDVFLNHVCEVPVLRAIVDTRAAVVVDRGPVWTVVRERVPVKPRRACTKHVITNANKHAGTTSLS